jgi:type II restriction enzyme
MADDKLNLIQTLIETIPELTLGQLHWMHRIVEVFTTESQYTIGQTDLFDETALQNFGDAMRVHHSFSAEPFSKDKFEYVLVEVLNLSGYHASLAPKGNPGHDITVDGVKLSLKTQANKSIKEDMILIKNLMELGQGQWTDNPEDLEGLRQQFLNHLEHYDRILSLRALQKHPQWKYELIEIPKDLLKLARSRPLEMKTKSRQTPKPGYCTVCDRDRGKLFDLYFDGGTERKLQVRNLRKDRCRVHATWEFLIP